MTPQRRVWVVVPAYNEAARLGEALTDLLPLGLEVIVVDDGSSDGTSAIAAANPVWVLRHPVNCGQGAALRTGIRFALRHGADVIVTFDADGQHEASDVPAVVEPIATGRADVAMGSRVLGRAIGMPWMRRLVLAAGRLLTRAVWRMAVTDPHNGFRAFSAAAARQIAFGQDGMAHASEIVAQVVAQRLRWVEVPVTVRYSAATLAKGQSSWNAVRILADLMAARVVR